MNKKIISILSLIAILLSLSVSAFAVEDSDEFSNIMDSYYYGTKSIYSAAPNISAEDPHRIMEEDSTIDSEKLIEMFTTETASEEELLALCERLKAGEKLIDNIISREQIYTITTDADGNNTGYAVIATEDFSVREWGEIREDTRLDLRLSNTIKTNLTKSNLDLADSKAVFCTIENFATGALIYDDNAEYFIPTVDSIESMNLLTVGEMYSIVDLADIIKNNIRSAFPINEVGEDGNPNTGAGAGTPSLNGNSKTAQTYMCLFIISAAGAIVCFTAAYKAKQNNAKN